eukprot:scaffold63586_cov32-Tisochrysis_lutea.AAC.4
MGGDCLHSLGHSDVLCAAVSQHVLVCRVDVVAHSATDGVESLPQLDLNAAVAQHPARGDGTSQPRAYDEDARSGGHRAAAARREEGGPLAASADDKGYYEARPRLGVIALEHSVV